MTPNKYMYAKDLQVISPERLSQIVPSVNAKGPSPDRSARYEFVDSLRVLGYLQEEGYKIADANGARTTRGGTSREFGAHTIRLRSPFGEMQVGELYPEIVFTNSHNGSCRARLDLGIYRVACSNGMVISADAGMSFTIPHVGDQKAAVLNAAQAAMDFVPQLGEAVNRWNERILSIAEIREFDRRAKMLRTGVALARDLDLTECRREGDNSSSLWTIFNRTQEALIKGGATYRSPGGRILRTRPLMAVKKNLEVNQKLWDIAAEFLPA